MAKIEIKIKQNSTREKLTTISGHLITKKKYVIVDDTDRCIESFLNNRNDLLIRDFKEKIKDSSKSNNKEIFIE